MKTINVGVVGIGRGAYLAKSAADCGMKVVAVCDKSVEGMRAYDFEKDIALYDDYDIFLKHENMDAVIIANFFHEHAPLSIKALNAGKHVLSETITNSTLAEGVELIEAVEKSGKIFMLAENYAFAKVPQEMRKIYLTGEIGEILYAEGEYIHSMPSDIFNTLSKGEHHWRNIMPATYYCTHAMSPLMYTTDTYPVSVNAQVIAHDNYLKGSMRKSDALAIILCRMNNGAIFRITGWGNMGNTSIWYRLFGSNGSMESIRGEGLSPEGAIRIMHEPWNLPENTELDRTYRPEWQIENDKASQTNHGGGDFWTNYFFAKAIRDNVQPYFDVYKSVAMSSVGILGWKSAINKGANFEMPNWQDKEERKICLNDHFSPFYYSDGRLPNVKSMLNEKYEPTEEDIKAAKTIWEGNPFGTVVK